MKLFDICYKQEVKISLTWPDVILSWKV